MQGGKEKVPIIKAIADAGVPVMSHVGMCPHFMHLYGGFKLQGKTADEALRIIEDGIAIEAAGACGFEIEAVPFPDADHAYSMRAEEVEKLQVALRARRRAE
jgi:3-methyl-2-oxobutanoate hydroxymethyltransferase